MTAAMLMGRPAFPSRQGPQSKVSGRNKRRQINRMIGIRYETCRLTTARDRMALKAVVEPMLMRLSSMRRKLTTIMDMVGICRRLSTLAIFSEKGRPGKSSS